MSTKRFGTTRERRPIAAPFAAIAVLFGALLAPHGLLAAPAECLQGPVQTEVERGVPMDERLAGMARALTTAPHAVVLGDSIAVRWPREQLEPLLGQPVVYLANGGEKMEHASWMVEQVNPAAAAGVRVVLVSAGTNNLMDDDCAFSRKATALMQRIRSRFPRAAVYVVGMYQKGLFGQGRREQVMTDNAALKRAAASQGMSYVDMFDPMAGRCAGQASCALFEPNRVHPSAAGFAVMTRALRSAMGR